MERARVQLETKEWEDMVAGRMLEWIGRLLGCWKRRVGP